MNKPPTGEKTPRINTLQVGSDGRKRTESGQMNDMGRFVLCKERLCRLRIAKKGHGQINMVKLLKKTRGGGVEILLPKVGVT